MSEIGTQGNEILVDSPDEGKEKKKYAGEPGGELVSWVVSRVNKWRDHRDLNYKTRWEEYWRMWRGQWSEADKNRLSERSRLIAPALSQAVEMSVAEVEEAMLSREVWFDIADDHPEETAEQASAMRDRLTYDLDKVNAKSTISEALLNGAIFGTGCIKLNQQVLPRGYLAQDPTSGEVIREEREEALVTLESYRPDEIIPDPGGKNVNDCLGIALEHRSVSIHSIMEKVAQGVYYEDAASQLGSPSRTGDELDKEDGLHPENTESVNVVEYHGKVPARLLNKLKAAKSILDEIIEIDMDDTEEEGPLVEAIVTYANDGTLLRAIPSPWILRDRAIVIFAWEKVPGRLWGRGVCEKGYNPQKALDAELRARADALGFISSPMLGIDSGRIPRGFKPEIKPGKVWLTQGPPGEVIQPVAIGQLNPSTFNQTAELTQMVQMGTGSFDTATQLKNSSTGGSAATGGSMMLGAFVKRSKRAIQNVERNLLVPLIEKAAVRYMQFDPQRYPFLDVKFCVKASLGIIAREVEQLNLTQLMAMLPEQFPEVKVAVAMGIVEMSSVINKTEIIAAMKQAMQPPSEEEQQRQQEMAKMEVDAAQAALQKALLENQNLIAESQLTLAKVETERRVAKIKEVAAEQEWARIQLNLEEIKQFGRQNDISEKRLDLQEQALDHKKQQDSTK